MTGSYILIDGKTTLEPDISKWAKWFENADKQIAYDEVNNKRISTVFLGLDHGFLDSSKPILWETMIFGNINMDEYCERYSSAEDAIEGHKKAVELVKNSNKSND